MRRKAVTAMLAICVTIATAIFPMAAFPTAASANPNLQLWCGSWLKDVTATYRVIDLAHGNGPDGSTWHIRWGYRDRYTNDRPYVWAMLRSARPGDQIALIWKYGTNQTTYQCGDAAGHRTATVGSSPYSTSTIARTAGVPGW